MPFDYVSQCEESISTRCGIFKDISSYTRYVNITLSCNFSVSLFNLEIALILFSKTPEDDKDVGTYRYTVFINKQQIYIKMEITSSS